ncbi:divalent metal cation transporter [Aerococcaceae bacterium DSM 111176]|nr:divalent metal cation transporter [Aerococcaceae bacterium DSM 111176]
MEKQSNNNLSTLIGAAFLMATSAIGPGFLTQTVTFTEQLGSNFAFVILVSLILCIGAQLNVWRIIGVSGLRGQDIANKVFPGLGHLIAILIVIGGLAFNIGNIGGAGLGLNALFGIPVEIGAIISAAIAVSIFLVKEAGKAIDKFTQFAGAMMILLMIYIAFVTNPPVGEFLQRTVVPTEIDWNVILTIVGGTVGGYITFSGGHRLIDAGITGEKNLKQITQSSILGLSVTAVMRILLTLATLGVLVAGAQLDASNPAAAVFQFAAGNLGYKFFGAVMWAAATSSVVGCAYTSISFLRSMSSWAKDNNSIAVVIFIIISTAVFVVVGNPAQILVIVGLLNGLILPVTLGSILMAAHNEKIVGSYKQPKWMTGYGWVVVALTAFMSARAIINFFL